jgi:hypothetical protein
LETNEGGNPLQELPVQWFRMIFPLTVGIAGFPVIGTFTPLIKKSSLLAYQSNPYSI